VSAVTADNAETDDADTGRSSIPLGRQLWAHDGEGRAGRIVRWLKTPSGWRDAVLFGSVYLAYSMSRFASVSPKATAVAHGRSVESLERHLHVAVEAQVQAFFNHGPIPQMFNYTYLAAQVFVIPGVLLFLYLRGPQRVYRRLRDTVLFAWLLALPVYALYPTAPPRLAGLGIIDTVSKDSIIPLNARLTTSLFNPYASVPSMHAGLAVAISVALVVALRHRWSRILAALWGPVMCVDVIATGNHYAFDVVAGLIFTGGGYAVAVGFQRLRDSRQASTEPIPHVAELLDAELLGGAPLAAASEGAGTHSAQFSRRCSVGRSSTAGASRPGASAGAAADLDQEPRSA
jgi:membrane-associated phospholipid phosphatase